MAVFSSNNKESKDVLPSKYEAPSWHNIAPPAPVGAVAFKIGEAVSDGEPSSRVSDYDYSYTGRERVLMPEVPFYTLYQYYTTIGKFQSTVDAYVSEVCTREYEFEGNDGAIKKLEKWAKEFKLGKIIESMTRDLLVCGNHLLGTTDWKPVQMDHLVGLKRSDVGVITDYVYSFNGKWEDLPLKPKEYIHARYIDVNRKPWSIGIFHALTTSFIWNNHQSIPEAELYRRHLQNVGQVEEKYAFPRILYAFDSTGKSQAELDKIVAQLKAQKPGERWLTTMVPELITETIDGARSGLLETTTKIQNDEVTAGLQSSVNRLRTEPSAMADAKESNTKDDAMLLYIFSKIEDVINNEIIPLLLGENTDVEFHFGQQDDMELSVQEMTSIATMQIANKPVVSPEEVRAWIEQKGLPLDEEKYKAFIQDVEQKALDAQQHTMDQIAAKQGAGPIDQKIDSEDVKDLQKEAYRSIIKAAEKASSS